MAARNTILQTIDVDDKYCIKAGIDLSLKYMFYTIEEFDIIAVSRR